MATHKADYRFIVKELSGNTVGLECYPQTVQFPFISSTGCMYIRLKKGTSLETARDLKDKLDDLVDSFIIVEP
jgi:hypothetical protein